MSLRRSISRCGLAWLAAVLHLVSGAGMAAAGNDVPDPGGETAPGLFDWDAGAHLEHLFPGYDAQIVLTVGLDPWSLPAQNRVQIHPGCRVVGQVYNDGPDGTPELDYAISVEWPNGELLVAAGVLPPMPAGETQWFIVPTMMETLVVEGAGLGIGSASFVIDVEGLPPVYRPVFEDGVFCPASGPNGPSRTPPPPA